MKISAVGIAWYDEPDYPRLRELFEDGHKLPPTYKEWLQAANQFFESRKSEGVIAEKVYLAPEEFAAWCAAHGLNIDSDARIKFANEFVGRKYRDKS